MELRILIPIILFLSNLAIIPSLIKSWNRNSPWEFLLLLLLGSASTLMHLSEQKHHLQGFFPKWSQKFLWLDRIFSGGTGIYLFWKAYLLSEAGRESFLLEQIGKSWLGLIFLFWGEQTSDQLIYLGTHLSWHFFAYSIVYSLI